MTGIFKINDIEYTIAPNPINLKPMVVRVDGLPVENRKEICRIFLKQHGWTNEDFGNKVTNELERNVLKFLDDSSIDIKVMWPKKEIQVTKKVNINKSNIPSPTIEEVEHWLKVWDDLEDYHAQEDALDKLFYGDFKSNDNIQNILIKCSVLNDFYSTHIFKIYPIAKHILNLQIDKQLESGDPELVNKIAKVKIKDSEKTNYSFASKYCSHHNPLEFPIYDSYVDKVLTFFKKRDHFYSFNKEDLKNYPKFKEILIEFRKFYKLEKYNLKELDKFLWQFGKKYFPKNY